MSATTCPNCRARNPRYRSACRRCNAALSSAERERRERRRVLNELREANGKEPLPAETVDESVEPAERHDATAVGVLLVLFALVMLVVLGASALGWSP